MNTDNVVVIGIADVLQRKMAQNSLDSQLRCRYRFAVYEHNQIKVDKISGNEVKDVERYIVIKNQFNMIIAVTPWAKYAGAFLPRKRKIAKQQNYQTLCYIVQALTYLFCSPASTKNDLFEVTAEDIKEFLDYYAGNVHSDGTCVNKDTLDRCSWAVCSFFGNVSIDNKACKLDWRDILEPYKSIKKSGSQMPMKEHTCYRPAIRVKKCGYQREDIFRDFPVEAACKLIELANIHAPDIAFLIVLGITAGLRPGEGVNSRQDTSPLGRSIDMEIVGSNVMNVCIDLRHEYILREDGKSVGHIKKPRKQIVYPPLIPLFLQSYSNHKEWLKRQEFDEKYCPMFVDKKGNAMTYTTYRRRFQSLVKDYLVPELCKSKELKLRHTGEKLKTVTISPHVLRHVFSVVLALRNENVSAIQSLRGDKSPETALLYLSHKGDMYMAVDEAHATLLDVILGAKKMENKGESDES